MFAIWVAIFARLECNSAVRGNYFRDGSLDRWDIHHFHPMKGYLRKNIRFIFVLNWEIRNQRTIHAGYTVLISMELNSLRDRLNLFIRIFFRR